jgi:iron complex outermembrane receptor protein
MFAGYVFEEMTLGEFVTVEGGLRIESTRVEGMARGAASRTKRSFVPVSGSIGVLVSPLEWFSVALTGSISQRAPSGVELFAMGPHEATATFETGDPSLDEETTFSGDLTLRFDFERLSLETSNFITRYNDYIYGQQTGRSCDESGFCQPGFGLDLKELDYVARDALFYGGEISFDGEIFDLCGGAVGIDARMDWVRARFYSGMNRNVPRIPPLRLGGGVFYRGDRLRGRVSFTRAQAVTDTAAFETPTPAYTFVDLELGYRLTLLDDRAAVDLFLVARNLNDDIARNAIAFNKDDVVLPGRGVRVGVRGSF